MGVKLGTEEIRFIGLFESITGATIKDCLVSDDQNIVYVIKEGEIGLAIGKKGANLSRVRDMINRGINIVEYSDDPSKFIENILKPAKIKNVRITQKNDGRTVAVVDIQKRDRGIAIGKSGKTIHLAKTLLKRHHSIDDVVIM
ncbi:MAG: NusA-like transcription termination signal-binding factor [Candidatus Methanofastidiosia archaeon]